MADDSHTVLRLEDSDLVKLHDALTSSLLAIVASPAQAIENLIGRELDAESRSDRDLMASIIQAACDEIDRRIPRTQCDCVACVAWRSGR